MTHRSDQAIRLRIAERRWPEISGASAVWLFVLPPGAHSPDRFAALAEVVESLDDAAVIAILCDPHEACAAWQALRDGWHFQLWVAVKLSAPRDLGPGHLPQQHAALLILSKYRGSLRHTKTRIEYTYCPACDRTTKDYGGKKHIYHAQGTLISDVWRDIAWDPARAPDDIAARLADLFGLAPYRELNVVLLPSSREPPASAEPALARGSRLNEAQVAPQLLRGDCLQELACLPDNSVDFCFADPPYNIAKNYDRWDDALDTAAYFAWCDRWLDELARVLKPGRTCAVLNIPLWALRHHAHLQGKLRFQNWIAWEGLSLPVRMIMPAHYAIVCFSKGAPRPLPGLATSTALAEWYCLRAGCGRQRQRDGSGDRTPLGDLWWDIHRLKHNSKRVDHPCQLPPALLRRLIEVFTQPGELVLDPFDGAGTTTLCAAALGRRYLGIELSPEYHALARQRHELLRAGGDPFAKAQRALRSKNSRVRRIGAVPRAVSKKTLQLEIRRIAERLGRRPTRDDVAQLSAYPLDYYDKYFIGWNEVCAAARTTGMSEMRPER